MKSFGVLFISILLYASIAKAQSPESAASQSPDAKSAGEAPIIGPCRMPVANSRVTRKFGPTIHPVTLAKRTLQVINVAGKLNDPALAVFDGKVIAKGYREDFGNFLKIQHTDGTVATYSALSTEGCKVALKENDEVKEGQQLACVGGTGHTSGNVLVLKMEDKAGNLLDPEKRCQFNNGPAKKFKN